MTNKYYELIREGKKLYPTKEQLFNHLKYIVFDFFYNDKNIDIAAQDLFIEITANLNYYLIKKYKLDIFEDTNSKDAKYLQKMLFGMDQYFLLNLMRYSGYDENFYSKDDFRYHFEYVFGFKIALFEYHKKDLLGWNKTQNWDYMIDDYENDNPYGHFMKLVFYTRTDDLFTAPLETGDLTTYVHDYNKESKVMFNRIYRFHSGLYKDIAGVFTSFVNFNVSGKYRWRLESLRINRE